MPWAEALRMHGCVSVVVRTEHTEDLLLERCDWAGTDARVVRDRDCVALDLVDAQKEYHRDKCSVRKSRQ